MSVLEDSTDRAADALPTRSVARADLCDCVKGAVASEAQLRLTSRFRRDTATFVRPGDSGVSIRRPTPRHDVAGTGTGGPRTGSQRRGFRAGVSSGRDPEGLSIQQTLRRVIRATGLKEFRAKVRMASPSVLRAIHPQRNQTQETVNRLLGTFRLRLSLAPIGRTKTRHAA